MADKDAWRSEQKPVLVDREAGKKDGKLHLYSHMNEVDSVKSALENIKNNKDIQGYINNIVAEEKEHGNKPTPIKLGSERVDDDQFVIAHRQEIEKQALAEASKALEKGDMKKFGFDMQLIASVEHVASGDSVAPHGAPAGQEKGPKQR